MECYYSSVRSQELFLLKSIVHCLFLSDINLELIDSTLTQCQICLSWASNSNDTFTLYGNGTGTGNETDTIGNNGSGPITDPGAVWTVLWKKVTHSSRYRSWFHPRSRFRAVWMCHYLHVIMISKHLRTYLRFWIFTRDLQVTLVSNTIDSDLLRVYKFIHNVFGCLLSLSKDCHIMDVVKLLNRPLLHYCISICWSIT